MPLRRAADADSSGASVAAVAAAALGATIVITWDLWRSRDGIPNLPAVSWLAGPGWGVPLLVGCLLAALRPRVGGLVFVAVLAAAILGDQLRLQPEIVSLTVLLVAPAFGATGRSIARWHLAALWLWAGLHKVLSVGWPRVGAGEIAGYVDLPSLRPAIAVALPAVEIALGLSVFWRRAWPVTAVVGAALHIGIFVTLSPLLGDWNAAVWPWNLALAVAARQLFGQPERSDRLARGVAIAFLASPALFYVGAIDTYLAHNLYAANAATAHVCRGEPPQCSAAAFRTIDDLDVPMPPEPRLFRQLFDEICEPGSTLRIVGRWTRLDDPPRISTHQCAVVSE